MELQFVFGRAGTGKTKYCLEKIKEAIDIEDKIYVITPEQFSYMQEKKLLSELNKNAILNAEVITFNRMLDRIYGEVGKTSESLITKSSKAMLLYSILTENKENLTYLGKTEENLDLAIKEITEFKKHNVKIEALEKNVEEVEDTSLKLKIKDMLLIYKKYEEKMLNLFFDEEDKLSILAKSIEKSTMFDDAVIFIDEFAGFTSQEYEIIRQIMKKAKKVTITSCIDFYKDTYIFKPNKQVVDKIVNIAKEENIKINKPIVLDKTYRFKNEELKHLEENIYENKYEIYNKENENIYLFLANNPYTEIEYVAKKIIELVQDEDYSFNDIAIITQNIDSISAIVRAVFSKYGIPVYMDEKDELTGNIAIKYILAILEIFAKNWSNEAVINYAKLGFLDVEKEEIYKLESYTKKWGIKGNRWYKEDFKYGEDLESLNETRKKIVEPLLNLKDNLSKQKTALDITKAIYKFLEENNFYEALNKKIELLEEKNELKIASNYKQSIENLEGVLNEIIDIFKDQKLSFDKYKEILKIGLKYRELGSIPQTLDQVVVGDVDRTRTHKVKACFIIGVNDGVFPSINKNEGFFNDKDRETLKNFGTELAKGTNEMLYDEEFNIYKALTIAEEKLFLSYASSNNDGASLRSSVIITKLKKIFPKLKETSDVISKITKVTVPEATFGELLYNLRCLKNGEKIDDIWFQVYNWYSQNEVWHEKLEEAMKGIKYSNKAENISLENIEKLYGKTLKASISKLEQYEECPFSFHLKYGLKLKEEEEFKLKSIDTGSFMHEVVDTFFEEIKEEDIKKLSKEDIYHIVNRIIDEKLSLSKNAIFTSTPKFIVLTNRLKKVVSESIYYIVYQMQNSNFEILGNEVEFSKKIDNVEIVGKIDRLDTAENKDGKFIRIIDYKSSSKSLDLNKMVTGLQIQLLTYIDVMCEKTKSEPAGMLYFNLIEPIVSKNRNLSDEEIEEEIRKSFRMKGLILADVNVIKMMDNSLDSGSSNIIPAALDKEGNISKTRSSTISKEEFTLLQKRIKTLIKQISKEILSGKIDINPVYNVREKKSACEYCQYKTICMFNTKENSYSYIANKTKEEIFEELKKDSVK